GMDDQDTPSHLAIHPQSYEPGIENNPPATSIGTCGPGPSSSKETSDLTPPGQDPQSPVLKPCQPWPSHRATPALGQRNVIFTSNDPPAYSSGKLGPSPSASCTAKQ